MGSHLGQISHLCCSMTRVQEMSQSAHRLPVEGLSKPKFLANYANVSVISQGLGLCVHVWIYSGSWMDYCVCFRRVVLSGARSLPHPQAITVFEDQIFFTDGTKMAVRRANMYDGSDVTTLVNVAKTVSTNMVNASVLFLLLVITNFHSKGEEHD